MNDKELKPHIDRLKKDPSLNEILNFTQAIIKKLPEDTNAKANANNKQDLKNQLNADTLNSLAAAAQNFVNPATLSVLSQAFKQSETKAETPETTSLKFELKQLSAELNEVKDELIQAKIQLTEQSQRLEELGTAVQHLKRRRRR